MAARLGNNKWSDDPEIQEALYGKDLNDTFNAVRTDLVIIDDSDELDFSTWSNSFGSDSDDKQKTYNITSEQLQNKRYIVLEVLGRFFTRTHSDNGAGNCSISFTLTKDPEGTPVVLATQNVAESDSNGGADRRDRNRMVNNTVKHYYAITEDDRSNGINLELKIRWSQSVTTTPSVVATSFTNRQIVFSLI